MLCFHVQTCRDCKKSQHVITELTVKSGMEFALELFRGTRIVAVYRCYFSRKLLPAVLVIFKGFLWIFGMGVWKKARRTLDM